MTSSTDSPPTDSPPTPGARYSPLHDVHVAAGATFTDFAGWQMPVRYSSDLAEHHAVRTAAGLFDLSHMAEFTVAGLAAADFLDFSLAGKLSAIEVGQAKYSLLLAVEGGIIDDVVVYRTGESEFVIVANASNRGPVSAALEQRLAEFGAGSGAGDGAGATSGAASGATSAGRVELDDVSDDTALIAVQGPAALAILEATDGVDASGFAGLRYYRALASLFQGERMLVARTGYTGEDGFELYLAPALAPALWAAIAEAGASHGIVPAGLASRDTLRLEAGMPLYGHELSLETFPVQAGLGRVPALSKGDFVGRAAVEAGPAEGAPVLVGLVAEGKRAARADYPVFAADDSVEPIGVVTSGALSPTLGHPIALAYVDPRYAEPGTELSVDIRGKRLGYTTTPLPFYRRKKD
ncbi:glycine cleavage system aminomethyltransferase GcvT [Herbiconiux daphne]|uniref:Aminomethyltransferase n=1 Tax=Herbiconiux daphne TaxID=2970914 RepID=A0ABT2H2P5_9MICO|nr:glycine cleavage system aminomethyltransferase GcvT [Herbiconiux daphne]MCS5734221.1 glycine cleavage system protein T [Herbiconiux daphne]